MVIRIAVVFGLRLFFIGALFLVECLRGVLAPLKKNLPLPLIKGKGIQGIGLPDESL